ncbi:toxin VasX [Pseudomonas sp. Marseille-QA0892]
MTAKNPNQADKAKSDAKSSVGACQLMKNKVQLLPLRYGLVERLDPSAELSLPYRLKSRPLGIRLIRDGWLYVIDNETGYLHEYRVEKGVVSKFVWKGNEAAQDHRQGQSAGNSLIFARGSTLHVSFSDVQWTAFKCSQVLKSRNEREHFMQRVDLSKATCTEGGNHLLTSQQAEKWLAEVAEAPTGSAPPVGGNPQEGKDYVWENDPLYSKTTFGMVRKQLLATYENDHLYLVFKDSLGVMQDLAQEQDTVVGWIEKWAGEDRNEVKYSIGNHIDTLMVVNDNLAEHVSTDNVLLKKTTPAQRQTIYDYINARNDLKGMQSSSAASPHYLGRPIDTKKRAATADVAAKKRTMKAALGDDLYDELDDDIEALKDHSHAVLEGKGLGARGIHDLVRHKEMRQYLERERVHLKRWNARLDRITEDRVKLFTATEYHRSAWYFDTQVPDQLMKALVIEQNCVRDLCRSEDSIKAVGEYFHKYPYYILPAFASRLDLNFLMNKSGDLIKWLDDARNLKSGLSDAQARLQEVGALLGNHWANSPSLSTSAQTVSQAVNAAYSPAIALRLQDWLAGVQSELNSPDLKAHLDKLDTYSNRAHRLGSLAELKAHGANLVVATEQDVSLFKSRVTTLIGLLDKENQLKTLRDRAKTDSKRRTISEAERQNAKAQKQQLNQQLAAVRQQRTAIINQLQNSVTATGAVQTGFVGVKLKMEAAQQNLLNEEIRRLRLGPLGAYGETGAHTAALKSSALPLVALFFQARNLGDALYEWLSARRSGATTLQQDLIFIGAISAPIASALSVYQNAHIALVDKALKSIAATSAGKGGMQFAVKLGKLGLGLGVLISPLALLGSAGTSWSNWNKWLDAVRTGTASEQAGALMAFAGDSSSTAVNAAITAKAFAEFGGLMMDASRAAPGQRVAVMGAAWATRGVRFLSFSARLTPWGLTAAALQFGGEALYNYGNLNDEQRWMLNSCWGLEDQDWDWPTHSQHLAEATLRPEISDKGTIERTLDGASVRRLVISLPGVSLASLRHQPLRLTAEWEYQRGWPAQDVGEQLRNALCKLDGSRLALALDISPDWVGPQSRLRLRLAVQPDLANKPLKHKDAYLYYAVPLHPTASRKPIKGVPGAGPTRIAPQWLDITPEYLHASG